MSGELVSVLLPVHKDNPYLSEAIDSILRQDYENFEILFLDNSAKGLSEDLWRTSKKIRYIKVPGQFGLSETLNVGIDESRGSFLMRMDYDDLCAPNRISTQLNFLLSRPEMGICGSFAEVIGSNIDRNVSPGEVIRRPISPDEIVEYLLYKNPLIHPTVFMRKSLILKYKMRYRKKFDSAEDLDFWSRSVKHFQLGNVDLPLLKYRIHESQYSRVDGTNSKLQSAIVKQRHAFWVLLHRRDLAFKAAKVILKSSISIAQLYFLKKMSSTFNKFD